MKKRYWASILSLIAFLLTGCSAARAPEISVDQAFEAGGAPMEEFEKTVYNLDGDTSSARNYGGEAVPIEPLVIRTASLSLVVDDPSQSADEIANLAEAMGGFVVSSNVYQTTYGSSQIPTARASITIRVPSNRLNEALDKLVEDVIEVQVKNVSGQDVTREYTDLQSRLRNLEAAEEQLREIMDAATDTEDVLRVFENLRIVREEIEIIIGQMNYFEDSAQLSAISIELIPDVLAQPLQIGGWRPEGTAKDALEALIRTLQDLADAGIWFLICVAPILVILGGPVFYVARTIIRRRRAKKEQATQDTDQNNED